MGDFAGIGHEQLLLIFDSFSKLHCTLLGVYEQLNTKDLFTTLVDSGTITKFSVTDLAQFTASSEVNNCSILHSSTEEGSIDIIIEGNNAIVCIHFRCPKMLKQQVNHVLSP